MTRSHKALSKNNCRNDTKIEKMKRWMCQSARWWWRDLNISLAFSRKGPCAATHALVILESIPCTSGVGSKQNMNFLWWAPFSALLLRINTSKGHPLCCKVASIRCLKDWNSGLVTLLLPEMQGTCSPTSMLFLVSCMEHTAPSISCRWAMCLYTTWQTMETTSNNNMCSTAWCASKALLLPLLLTACSQWSTPFSRPSSTAFHAWDNAFSGRVRFQYRCEENKVFCTDLGWVSSTLL